MKRILFTFHALRRMSGRRQDGIEIEDVYAACNLSKEILFKGVPFKIKLKGYAAKSGKKFSIVVVDEKLESGEVVLRIVTVIALTKDRTEMYNENQSIASYKNRRRMTRRAKKKERKYIEKPESIPKYRKNVRNAERA